jgi:hypothetical protein
MGMELRLHKINAPQSFLPRHLHAKTVVNMPGISAAFVEVGHSREIAKRLQGGGGFVSHCKKTGKKYL